MDINILRMKEIFCFIQQQIKKVTEYIRKRKVYVKIAPVYLEVQKANQRKEPMERNFGSAKEYHSFKYTNMKGEAKMDIKSALTFTCVNIKKLANLLDELRRWRLIIFDF